MERIAPKEVVNFDGILCFHGAAGGGHNLKSRWDPNVESRYQKRIKNCMTYLRFLELKRFNKLNDNNDGTYYIH